MKESSNLPRGRVTWIIKKSKASERLISFAIPIKFVFYKHDYLDKSKNFAYTLHLNEISFFVSNVTISRFLYIGFNLYPASTSRKSKWPDYLWKCNQTYIGDLTKIETTVHDNSLSPLLALYRQHGGICRGIFLASYVQPLSRNKGLKKDSCVSTIVQFAK